MFYFSIHILDVPKVKKYDMSEKRKWSDSVQWQKPLHQQKIQNSNVTTQKRHQNETCSSNFKDDYQLCNLQITIYQPFLEFQIEEQDNSSDIEQQTPSLSDRK